MGEQGETSRSHEGPTDAFITYHTFASEVHVLLVDHDKECLIATARMLEACSYRVTVVELASSAILLFQKGNEHFDLVMANVHSPDSYGFQLLEDAMKMDLPVILMSDEENAGLARVAIERGASLFIEKPVIVETSMYLWQHVLREHIRSRRHILPREEDNDNDNNSTPQRCETIRRRGGRGTDGDEYDHHQQESTELQHHHHHHHQNHNRDNSNNHRVKIRKPCAQWTEELHAKFMDAVHQLGEGRCYPKEILEAMNVPGLTRMQVASHLQKCRNDNWRGPGERKISYSCSSTHGHDEARPSSVEYYNSRRRRRRFGMAPLNINDVPAATPSMEIQLMDHLIARPYYHEIYASSSAAAGNNIINFGRAGETTYGDQLEPQHQLYYDHIGTSTAGAHSYSHNFREISMAAAANASGGDDGNLANYPSSAGTATHHHGIHQPTITPELSIATPRTATNSQVVIGSTCARRKHPSDCYFYDDDDVHDNQDREDMDNYFANFNNISSDVCQGPTTSDDDHTAAPNPPHGINLELSNPSPIPAWQNSITSNKESNGHHQQANQETSSTLI